MVQLCSCFQCGTEVESIVLESDPHIIPSNNRLSSSSTTIMGHHHSSRCFTSQFPMRTTGRTVKWLCLLVACLAFCIGIGIGVLIPFYFLPVTPSELVLNGFPTTPSSVSSQQQIPHSVINTFSSSGSNNNNNQDSSVKSDGDNSGHSSYSVNSRTDTSGVPLEPQQLYRRPLTPSVQFVAPESRILSLHPVQQTIPPVQYPKGGWELLNRRSSIATKDSVSSSSVGGSANDSNNIPKKRSPYVNSGNQGIVDGIFWGSSVEQGLPQGYTSEQLTSWRRFVHESSVSRMTEGCGRMQNRLITFANGTEACARYRQNFDQIQGEIFSYYLSQLLGLENLAPSTMTMIQPMDDKWSGVQKELTLAQWAEKKPVVVTKFLENLTPAYIPSHFKGTNRRLHPSDVVSSLNSVESPDFSELAQWSDLIVFDYLTANLDRMVNNLYNLQWNPSMMEAPAHNLAKDKATGLLVFLDNESGLLHGYRLLDKYEQYHRIMLESLCVFRRSTVQALKKLRREKNVGTKLKQMFKTLEPSVVDYLPMLPEKSVKILNHRIDRVYDQIMKCESLYL